VSLIKEGRRPNRRFFSSRFVNRRSLLSSSVRELGGILAIFGGVIMVAGIALWAGFGAGWLGRLPGDIRVERGNTAFYFPIVTCIIVSIVLTLLLSLFRR
jgi:Protein of unknown function (DUF2905)